MISPLNTRGGGSVLLWELCKKLSDKGNQISYIERIMPGDKRKSYPSTRYFFTVDRFRFLPINIFISLVFNMVKALYIKADIVYVGKLLPNSCIPAIIKKAFGCKIVVMVDDLDYELYKDGVVKSVMRFCYKSFSKRFDMLIFTSKKLMDHVYKDLSVSKNRLYLIPQGVDFNLFRDTCKDDRLRASLGISEEKVILYLASLGLGSDFELIVSAFKKIKMKNSQTKLLVIGGGNKLRHCKELIEKEGLSNNVIIIGYVEHEKIARYLALCDLGINLMADTVVNNFRTPIKVNEYLAAGLPAVVNDIGDYSMVQDYIMIVKNAENFSEAALKAMESDSPELRSRRKEFIRNNLDWLSLVKELNQVLKTMLIK
ncbi:MAG: glycosyltransferase [Candidatus Omnitrophota bacterium]